jgi:hypothetical protein
MLRPVLFINVRVCCSSFYVIILSVFLLHLYTHGLRFLDFGHSEEVH